MYRSYMDEPQVYFSTQDGVRTVVYHAVDKLRQDIKDNNIKNTEQVLSYLDTILGPEVEPLEPFSIN